MTITRFKMFLEAKTQTKTASKLNHLSHIEDHALSGPEGIGHAVGTLRGLHDLLNGKQTTLKLGERLDGSPSIAFGWNPENKKFFVSAKTWGNNKPKINYTEQDIDENHGHDQAVANKLKLALEHLPKVTPQGKIYHGDVVHAGDAIDNGNHYAFKPNGTTYKVYKNSIDGSKLGKSKLGVAVYTEYHDGSDLKSMKPKFDVDTNDLIPHSDVHVIPTVVNPNIKKYSDEDKKKFEAAMTEADEARSQLDPETFDTIDRHSKNLTDYVDSELKAGKRPSHPGFRDYMVKQGKTNLTEVKTSSAQERKSNILSSQLNDIELNKDHIGKILALHNSLQAAKNVLAGVANTSRKFGSEPETSSGMVVIDPFKNVVSKIVNRTHSNK